MTSLHLFLLILLMRVAHFSYIVTSIIVYGTFKAEKIHIVALNVILLCCLVQESMKNEYAVTGIFLQSLLKKQANKTC